MQRWCSSPQSPELVKHSSDREVCDRGWSPCRQTVHSQQDMCAQRGAPLIVNRAQEGQVPQAKAAFQALTSQTLLCRRHLHEDLTAAMGLASLVVTWLC